VSGAYWHIDKTSRKTRVPLVNVFTGWVYGPGGWFETLARGIRNGTMRIIGEGSNYMSFIHVDDLAQAYGKMAETLPFGERYCIVDGNPVTQREMANFIAKEIGGRTPKSVEMESYARLAGDLAAESMSCSTRVLGERTRRILMPELKYPSYMDGMPAVIEEMGILHREEKAA